MNSREKVYDPLLDDVEAPSTSSLFSKAETRKWFIILTMGAAVVYATRVTMPLCLVSMSSSQKWSKTDSGSLLSAFFWGYALTQVIGGTLSDRIGGEIVLLWSSLVWSFMTFLHPVVIHLFAGSKDWVLRSLLVVRIIMGGAQGMFFPSMASLSSRRLSKSRRGVFFARASAGSSLGTIFIGSIGSYVLEVFSWEAVFVFISAISLGWLWMLYITARSVSTTRVVALSDPSTLGARSDSGEAVPWRLYLSNVAVWSVIVCHVAQNFCWHLLISWMPTYFAEVHSGGKGWVFNVFPYLFHLPMTILGSQIAKSMLDKGISVSSTRKVIQAMCVGLQTFALFGVSATSNFALALVMATIAISAGGFHANGALVNIQDIAPKHTGSIFGILNSAGAIPGFVSVYFAGFILETTKSWPFVFGSCALINVAGCIVFLLFGKGEPIV